MKLIEMSRYVDKQGCILLQEEMLGKAGLRAGDEVRLTLAVLQEETESRYPQLIITPQGVSIAAQLSGWQEDDDEEDGLTLPVDLLEAAEIPEGSDLQILCTTGAIVIMESDILDSLPDELCGLFNNLGIHPDTVREVMEKEGYFI